MQFGRFAPCRALMLAAWWVHHQKQATAAFVHSNAPAEFAAEFAEFAGHHLHHKEHPAVLPSAFLEKAEPKQSLLVKSAQKQVPSLAEDLLKPKKKRLMNAINKFRAEICAKMHKEQGESFGSFHDCEEFMNKACRPGRDQKMDGDRKEITSGEGYCEEFFSEAEKKGEEEVAKEEAAEANANAEKKGKGRAEAIKGTSEDEVTDEGKASLGSAPSNAPAAASSPASGGAAPAPAPAAVTLNGVPAPAAHNDIDWYYKNGGNDQKSRMGHMDASKGLPVNGFSGHLVKHEDQKTAGKDWQREFGGKDYDAAWAKACEKHASSPWCMEQSLRKPRRSGLIASTSLAGLWLLVTMVLVELF